MLDIIAKELQTLEVNGCSVPIRHRTFILEASAPVTTADAVVQFEALGHGSFHGLCGCTSCSHPAKTVGGMTIYPVHHPKSTNLRTRSDLIRDSRSAVESDNRPKSVLLPTKFLGIPVFITNKAALAGVVHAIGQGQVKSFFH